MSATIDTRERAKTAERQAAAVAAARDEVRKSIRTAKGLIVGEAYRTGGSVGKALAIVKSQRRAPADKSAKRLCKGMHSLFSQPVKANGKTTVGTLRQCRKCDYSEFKVATSKPNAFIPASGAAPGQRTGFGRN